MVHTTATWRGHAITVDDIHDGRAQFVYFGMDLPASPSVYRVQSDEWHGAVPVDELSDVVEVVEEIPF